MPLTTLRPRQPVGRGYAHPRLRGRLGLTGRTGLMPGRRSPPDLPFVAGQPGRVRATGSRHISVHNVRWQSGASRALHPVPRPEITTPFGRVEVEHSVVAGHGEPTEYVRAGSAVRGAPVTGLGDGVLAIASMARVS